MTENNLPITKEQFDKAVINFVYTYERLPYQPEDEVEVELKNDNGELETRLYRASRYVTSYYEDQDNMSKEILENNVITYKMISDITGITEAVLKNAINKETKNPEKATRRAIEMFFNKDFYEELGKYATKCEGCKKCKGCKSKYFYWISVIHCPMYKKK